MNMNKALLITRPNHDLATNYLFHWSAFVIEEASKKGFRVLDLKEKRANKKDFNSYIKRHKPRLVVFNGHGSKDTIAGHNNEVLIKAARNEKILSRKVVYARSCDAARNLGPKCIQKGTLAFIGYTRKYIFGYSQSKISRPLEDKLAKLFLEPSNLVPISLLKGNTVENAYKKSQKAMLCNLHFMLSSKASQSQKDAAPYLWINRKYQTVLGDQGVQF